MTIAALLIALIATPSGDASSEPLLLDFHASWCGPCQQMRPAIELLIQKGYPVKSVDVDHAPDLAERYQVSNVPTFIVIDAAGQPLARTSGAQPASQLAKMYLAAKTKVKPASTREPRAEEDDDRDADRDRDADQGRAGDRADKAPADADAEETGDDRVASVPTNPKPWETTVRIKVHGQGSIGFGSGTIISSTPEESIILTCAHIFKLEGRQQASPARFPRRISVDLFDGKLSGQKPAQVHWTNETYEGKAIDYDFSRDVGLIRIRPGRKLPYSRVVPAWWKPQARMLMTTVGCSEGHDATAWNTTIINPSMRGLSGNPEYEAIECVTAPKQGRSGGGLYTSDGYLAGVCDFAEPRGNHGLYATPTSIHYMLDKNNLMACYAPVDRKGNKGKDTPQTLLTNNRPGTRRKAEPAIARAQSPDRDESNDVMIPPPEMLGIKSPAESPTRTAASGTRTSSSSGWHSPPDTKVASRSPDREGRAKHTELMLGSEFDNDRFGSMPSAADAEARDEGPAPVRQSQGESRPSSKWRPVRSPLPAQPTTR